MEVVVALLVMATGLVLLLSAIQGGLLHLNTARGHLESGLHIATAANLFSSEVSVPDKETAWQQAETVTWPDLPMLKMVCLEVEAGQKNVKVWVSKIQEEPPTS